MEMDSVCPKVKYVIEIQAVLTCRMNRIATVALMNSAVKQVGCVFQQISGVIVILVVQMSVMKWDVVSVIKR